jgi:hypothetical protein
MSSRFSLLSAPACVILQDRKRLPARFFSAISGAVLSRLR